MLPVVRQTIRPLRFETADEVFDRFRDEFDAMFRRTWGSNGHGDGHGRHAHGDGASLAGSWAGAPVGLWEDEDHVYIEMDVPGVRESDLEVTLHNGRLRIAFERRSPEGRRHTFDNRAYGRFERSVALPDLVTEDVQATLRGGVLEIRLTKRAEIKPRKIEVQSHSE